MPPRHFCSPAYRRKRYCDPRKYCEPPKYCEPRKLIYYDPTKNCELRKQCCPKRCYDSRKYCEPAKPYCPSRVCESRKFYEKIPCEPRLPCEPVLPCEQQAPCKKVLPCEEPVPCEPALPCSPCEPPLPCERRNPCDPRTYCAPRNLTCNPGWQKDCNCPLHCPQSISKLSSLTKQFPITIFLFSMTYLISAIFLEFLDQLCGNLTGQTLNEKYESWRETGAHQLFVAIIYSTQLIMKKCGFTFQFVLAIYLKDLLIILAIGKIQRLQNEEMKKCSNRRRVWRYYYPCPAAGARNYRCSDDSTVCGEERPCQIRPFKTLYWLLQELNLFRLLTHLRNLVWGICYGFQGFLAQRYGCGVRRCPNPLRRPHCKRDLYYKNCAARKARARGYYYDPRVNENLCKRFPCEPKNYCRDKRRMYRRRRCDVVYPRRGPMVSAGINQTFAHTEHSNETYPAPEPPNYADYSNSGNPSTAASTSALAELTSRRHPNEWENDDDSFIVVDDVEENTGPSQTTSLHSEEFQEEGVTYSSSATTGLSSNTRRSTYSQRSRRTPNIQAVIDDTSRRGFTSQYLRPLREKHR